MACDIGAFELESTQPSDPELVVNTADDLDDGNCTVAHCSLREAINAANSRPNDRDAGGATIPDQILFDVRPISSTPALIAVLAALPPLTDPLLIDGSSQPQAGAVVVDGQAAGPAADGLTILGGSSSVQALHIVGFGGHGVVIGDADGNTITGLTIADNGGDGIRVLPDSKGNTLVANSIYRNGGLAIDLGGDGPTANDTGDPDAGANELMNYPVLVRAFPHASDPTIVTVGRFHGVADAVISVEGFSAPTCDLSSSSSLTSHGTSDVTNDPDGDGRFRSAGRCGGPACWSSAFRDRDRSRR